MTSSDSADIPVKAPPASLKSGAFLGLSIGLLSISFAPIFIRLAETELGANATVLNRMVIFFVFFGGGRWLSRQLSAAIAPTESQPKSQSDSQPATTGPTATQYLLLVGAGAVSVTSLLLWAISLQHTTVAKCMLLNNLTPIFTSLGSWLLFKKQFDRRFLLGMAIALAGAIALSFEDLYSANGLLIGDLYALLSAVFLGSYFLLVEKLRQQFSATTILLWRCGVGSALILPLTLATEHQFFPSEMVPLLAVFGLGIISEGMGQRLLADSMQQFSSSFVALFLLLEPIISSILAWIIFAEALTSSTWVGFGVVLGGIYLAQSSQSSGQEEPSNSVQLDAVELKQPNLKQPDLKQPDLKQIEPEQSEHVESEQTESKHAESEKAAAL
ncbi:MAG: DMT family transporter [Cyanophyceae cyanobacterium]